jgi:hypothetical protein
MLRYLFSGLAGVAAFTVHEPPSPGGESRIARAESLLFIRDGFCWRAALFSPFYFLFRGEWRALAAYAAAAVVLILLLSAIGAQSDWIVWTFVLLNLIAGFEASELRRWSLDRAGWREVGSVMGRGREEAERRFFEAWMPTLAANPPPSEGGAALGAAVSPDSDIETRMEAAVKRLSQRLRQKFAVKTGSNSTTSQT